ncbi:hypothetical protein PHMEG_00029929 [Phytophthora megakarya]|uniref:Uncharacterized protein n=1 Tax=Phytophthora megakarya TaxID=4795 RepID=A0A225V308_9STRA|nr:hypothetical protein PHMEG_00029929 [Phytophthora megakarya]
MAGWLSMTSFSGSSFCNTSRTNSWTMRASSIPESAATYSAAVLDLATIVCLLHDQATGHPNKYTTYPDTLLRSTRSFAQSASVATMMSSRVASSFNFKSRDARRCRRRYLAASQAAFRGVAACLASCPTANEMSGRETRAK